MIVLTIQELAEMLDRYTLMYCMGGDTPQQFLQEEGYVQVKASASLPHRPELASLYQRKSPLFEAIQYTGKNQLVLQAWTGQSLNVTQPSDLYAYFDTFRVLPGDWIVKGEDRFHTYNNKDFIHLFELNNTTKENYK